MKIMHPNENGTKRHLRKQKSRTYCCYHENCECGGVGGTIGEEVRGEVEWGQDKLYEESQHLFCSSSLF